MKERYFKFRKSYADALNIMDDKQAGKFIKSLSDYVFNGISYKGNEVAVKSAMALVKNTLDADEKDKQYGSLGGKISAELRRTKKEKESNGSALSGCILSADSILKELFEPTEKNEYDTKKSFK